jgi:hypothetical protein
VTRKVSEIWQQPSNAEEEELMNKKIDKLVKEALQKNSSCSIIPN